MDPTAGSDLGRRANLGAMTETTPRTRNRSRTHDVVLFGATGFTGALVAEYLAKQYGESDVRIALAGRDRAKLERVRQDVAELSARAGTWPILVADAKDASALGAIAAATEVVCTTVGPYAKYGAGLVAACVRSGTDYCDLTGEVQFIRAMIDAHQGEAERTGARIVPSCGFDSIPSDLGTWMMHDAFRARGGQVREVRFYAGESKGGFSGGTAASMINMFDELEREPALRKVMGDPYALVPKEARGPDRGDQMTVRFDRELGMWTAPFIMAAINTRVVRRSNYLLGSAYGRDFRYSEVMSTGTGPAGLARATAITSGLGAFMGVAAVRPLRRQLEKRVLPKPGEGPDRESRERGFFVVRLIAKGTDRDGRDLTLRGRVEGKADPGYGETAKMLGESALCLALDGAKLDAPGGIRTPASTMGSTLLERLRAAGMVFRVE